MPPCDQNVCDCILGLAVGVFGFSYFLIYVFQLFIFHFPSTPDSITDTLAVIGFGVGTALWYANVIYHQMIRVFQDEDPDEKKPNTIWVGSLFLIWTAALPTIAFLFPDQPLLQLWYISSFTVIVVGNLPGYLFYEQSIEGPFSPVSLHLASVGLLALMPTIHTLAEPVSTSPQFAIASTFGQLMMGGLAGWAVYLFRPLERMGIVQNWRPSIHAMHLIWTYSLVSFSNAALEAAKPHLH
ncbi:uncharacterized protein N7469_001980 [Penicillium citrinum]|uniref:Uncharacterized protein n=1 Tax=Penicillium citrinum TaxID=5077 RepID=A0A9W9P9L7_PENCI|nr:uncharacterized protein N7469_001980 [Penicillium citrinum]KAJ5240389.1 hypothetical protein N7469_001980 [Penicillium citrinum]